MEINIGSKSFVVYTLYRAYKGVTLKYRLCYGYFPALTMNSFF